MTQSADLRLVFSVNFQQDRCESNKTKNSLNNETITAIVSSITAATNTNDECLLMFWLEFTKWM